MTDTFAARLRQLRNERGWTRWQLAAKTSLTDSTIYMLERGVAYPRSTTQDALAAAFGLTRDELMAGVVRQTRLDGREKRITT